MEVCKEMIKRNIKVKWTPYMSPHDPNQELLELLLKTGCDGIIYGPDSVSEKMLVTLEKEFVVADVINSAKLCKKLKIPFSLKPIVWWSR